MFIIQDESLFAKMGLNPTEVKRQYFGWLRNKQQIIEQTNKGSCFIIFFMESTYLYGLLFL